MKRKLRQLFKNLCCSQCKSDFDENSIEIIREENNLLVVHLVCQKCGKNFGVAFLGLSNIDVKEPLEAIEGSTPIGYDDVLDAHKFIENLDEHWQDYLPKDENN